MRDAGSVKKTPTFLQMEAVECGAASLGIILSYFGLILPLEELRTQCGVSRDGNNARSILQAARHYKLEGGGFRSDAEDLAKREMPLIIHWNFNHFLVLEGFKDGKARLNDPASGHRTVSMDEFKRSFTGVALRLKPGEGFHKGGKKFSVAADGRQACERKTGALFHSARGPFYGRSRPGATGFHPCVHR